LFIARELNAAKPLVSARPIERNLDKPGLRSPAFDSKTIASGREMPYYAVGLKQPKGRWI